MNAKSQTASRVALVMAGGTGGHIFPALAVAQGLREQGWQVHWLGAPGSAERPSMESRLVPPQGYAFETIDFGGVRGKGLATLLRLPLRLLKAFGQSRSVLRRVQPDVVLGFGGYITFPAGLMAVLLGKPLLLHEQNSVAGLANKLLARLATRVYSAFPDALAQASWIGNPLRAPFLHQAEPAQRYAGRSGPLQLLVVGGSLGARALNEVVPQALALLPVAQRPQVVHQSGAAQLDALRAAYAAAGVDATLTVFIDDAATAYAQADVLVARAGASTVTELAAVGVPALYVPFPSAVDDHQTSNARLLVDAGAGWLIQQRELTPRLLADMILKMERPLLAEMAGKAKTMQKTEAVNIMVKACEELVKP
jgi:UDP-N-acetylglucosamine--N-acetylmuramyl-(pentapeptide) pyrophosphoryl-undecaprenol N-acetylglucosamine transferase